VRVELVRNLVDQAISRARSASMGSPVRHSCVGQRCGTWACGTASTCIRNTPTRPGQPEDGMTGGDGEIAHREQADAAGRTRRPVR
jgi:hypothetical protein